MDNIDDDWESFLQNGFETITVNTEQNNLKNIRK